ncbi:MAG TPA: TatD family hydrolase [Chthoniobacteraceae bacterium]|nr:TatD family hydrolase [Chthoniobacteraceae bacterium]
MLTDTHVHLDFPEFENDLDAVLERARAAGVTRVITIGTDVEGSRQAVALAERYPMVYATVGIHPNNAAETLEKEPDAIASLRELAAHPKVVAIGETGLDYYRLPGRTMASTSLVALSNEEPRDVEAAIRDGAIKSAQSIAFAEQLDLAASLGLNVVIHQRGDCLDDTLEILAPFQGRLKAVFHCFTGTVEAAQRVLDLGHLLSFTGIATFNNAQTVQEVIATVPEGAYMVETDGPFLAPVPYRGKRCEPAYTRTTAEKVAALRDQTLEQVARVTNATADAFFRFRR